MEKTETVSLCGFQKPPSLAEVHRRFYLPGLSDVTDRDQSQPLTETEFPIKTVHVDLSHLHLKPTPVPLLEELPSTPSRDEPKTEDQNSDSKFNCPDCDKGFGTEKAMFGHMRIHQNRGSKNLKSISSGSKRKSESMTDHEIDTDRLQSKNWGATKLRGSKPLIDRNSPMARAALEIMILSRGGKITPDLLKYFPDPKRVRKDAVIMEPSALNIGGSQDRAKKKVKTGPHVCEKCGRSFPTGQQLGGHMRAHYKQPEDQHVAE